MQNLWSQQAAQPFKTPLQQRIYSSRLLGANPSLVLHGGGNTSVKTQVTDLFGDIQEVLYVKGSGWDLAHIEAAGFAPVKLNVLQRMATLTELSDRDMVNGQRAAMLDPDAPNPSVEAILHAIIPLRYVDHTHADAVVTLSNLPDGAQRIRALYGDSVLVMPYVMPGFALAKAVYHASHNLDWNKLKGMILLNHGVFTFADEAKASYDAMIALVSQAEAYLDRHQARQVAKKTAPPLQPLELQRLAQLRQAVAKIKGQPLLARYNDSDLHHGFACLTASATTSQRGTLTPDHVIFTKPKPLWLADDGAIDTALSRYVDDYQAYFNRHAQAKQALSPEPRWAVWQNHGTLGFGQDEAMTQAIDDLSQHTLQAIQWAENLSQWQPLAEADLFAVEYWALEQAKLTQKTQRPVFQGKIALVTGAASGIGKACVMALVQQGAAVAALDINPEVDRLFSSAVLPQVCDVTDRQAVQQAVANTVKRFGGLDILISNAGWFAPSCTLAQMDDSAWQRSLAVNLTSHQHLLQTCVPYLQHGIKPAVLFIASKNVPAPGRGAGAYSVAKAGLTQLARVAALELAAEGIRVNVLHPNAVFDTAIWTDEVLQTRARHYGLSVAEYKAHNLLRQEVTSHDVARLACAMVSEVFAKTTGAQLPIDGGNERVI
jgi:rhamnose utilization protein RhaD (predicted bifunctional aldolase and dehydrogenase)/NAD(P)-dependent dehydrogenase (short-subunit alcohol dehydrogenase family)